MVSERTPKKEVIIILYWYILFVVTSSKDGEARPTYESLYIIEGYGEGYFFSTWVAT
jgi:hypothetical protein